MSGIEGKVTRVGARMEPRGASDIDGQTERSICVGAHESKRGQQEDDGGVNASAQRRPMPVCPAERSGQPGEKRQGRDRVDRREEGREVFTDFN